jgi:hypothetical protein
MNRKLFLCFCLLNVLKFRFYTLYFFYLVDEQRYYFLTDKFLFIVVLDAVEKGLHSLFFFG